MTQAITLPPITVVTGAAMFPKPSRLAIMLSAGMVHVAPQTTSNEVIAREAIRYAEQQLRPSRHPGWWLLDGHTVQMEVVKGAPQAIVRMILAPFPSSPDKLVRYVVDTRPGLIWKSIAKFVPSDQTDDD